MRLSVAIAGEHALPSAFVVWRGFEDSFRKAGEYGFDGVELSLHRADDIIPGKLDTLLSKNGLVVSAVSTSQIFADGGMCLTHEDASIRAKTMDILMELVQVCGEFGKTMSLGRVRGSIFSNLSEGYFTENITRLCEEAEKHEVTIILEPLNRYESNLINNLDEAAELINTASLKNLRILADLFHMNIEDDNISASLKRNSEFVHYVHLADSNRLAPGWGHLDFCEVFRTLDEIGFRGWTALEVLPKPTPDKAAKQAVTHLQNKII